MVSPSDKAARRIDHLVLPTADLTVSRERLQTLGFTVAENARHPFGTENACVYFADGTYLEPLAVAQRETCEEAALSGNVFVARDLAFRFRRGEDGCSALVLRTQDAAQDRQSFLRSGLSAGDNLRFSRPYTTANGETAEASFELAFAADLRAPDIFFFTVQRLNPLDINRAALLKHVNGVTGIRQVILSEHNPSDFQYLLQAVTGQRDVNAHSFGLEIAADNGEICVFNTAGLKGFFGIDDGLTERGLRIRAVVLAVDGVDQLSSRFERDGVVFRSHGKRLIVPPAPGQGLHLVFETAWGSDG